jgi:pimeloyl-ACP methyl ester carboxylesterase
MAEPTDMTLEPPPEHASDDSQSGLSAPLLAAAAATAALAAAALITHFRSSRAERGNPPAGRIVEIDGLAVHYLEKGGGPPLVLLHGNAVMLDDFVASGLIDLAAERYRVIAFDRPGFGRTARPRDRVWTPQAQAALLRQAFGRLGIEQPVVLGHSWAALVALALALEHPREVRGLVLLAGYYFPTPHPELPAVAPQAIPVLGDLMNHTVSPLIGRAMLPSLLAKMFEPQPVPARFTAEFPAELMLRPSQIRAFAEDAALLIPAAEALEESYSALRLPVQLLAGSEDRIVDAAQQSARLARTVPRSELVIMPGCGHMLHHFAQEAVIQAIDAAAR